MFSAARLPCPQGSVHRNPGLSLCLLSLFLGLCLPPAVTADDKACHDKGASSHHCPDSSPPGHADRTPDAIGIQGTPRADLINQPDTLDVPFTATLDDAPGTAQSYVIGIDGGNGDDTINNTGTTNVDSTATATLNEWRLHFIDRRNDVGVGVAAEAAATGIDAGKNDDVVRNDGTLSVNADASASSRDIEIEFIGLPADVNAVTRAWSSAIGIEGGKGDDDLGSAGLLEVFATANVQRFSGNFTFLGAGSVDSDGIAQACALGLNGGKGDDLLWITDGSATISASAETRLADVQFEMLGVALGDALNTASATAVGLAGGEGDDTLGNAGAMTVSATATTVATDIGMGLAVDAIFSESVADASATGFSGGDGKDTLRNEGTATVTAHGDVIATRVALSAAGRIDATEADDKSVASATATGMDGGKDRDDLKNTGTLDVSASADINSNDISLTLVDALPGGRVRVPIEAHATATGMVGGDGDDIIENDGTTTVTSTATADEVAVDLSLVDVVSAETSVNAYATSIGLAGEDGDDWLVNNGTLTVNSFADADSVDVSMTIVDLSIIVDVIDLINPQDPGTDEPAIGSHSSAIGLAGGEGDDWLFNNGTATITATADSDTVGFSFNETGIPNPLGDTLDTIRFVFDDEPVVSADTQSVAQAWGVDTGAGDNFVKNTGDLTIDADARSTRTSVSVALPIPEVIPNNPLPSADVVSAGNAAYADAWGVLAYDGDDVIRNEGNLSVTATSVGISVSVLADIGSSSAPTSGFGLPNWGASLLSAGNESHSTATGVQLGDGENYLLNSGTILADANADANATTVDVRLSMSRTDIFSVFASLADTATISSADVAGITAGSGDDVIDSQGDITATALADTNSTSVTVDLQASKATPVVVGASVSSADTRATADSVGIDSGAGEDVITSAGMLTSKAETNVDAVGVDVGISGASGSFLVIQGAWVSASAGGTATATGISSGIGADVIDVNGMLVEALAEVNSVGVAVDVAGTTSGGGVAIPLTNASTVATANAYGIDTVGEPAADTDKQHKHGKDKHDKDDGEDDSVTVRGAMTVDATTDADADSVSIGAGIATSAGFGGAGAWAYANTTADADAAGVLTGAGADRVVNLETGNIAVTSLGESNSVGVGITGAGTATGFGLGLALTYATTDATANATGINTTSDTATSEDDADKVLNFGTLSATANTDADADSVAISVSVVPSAGFAAAGTWAEASVTANADANGIVTGAGADRIFNSGVITANTNGIADSRSVSVAGGGTAAGFALDVAVARATTEGHVNSTGIDAGDGDDLIGSTNAVNANATADVTSVGVSGSVGIAASGLAISASLIDVSTIGTADAIGINAGTGTDIIGNTGNMLIESLANTDSVGVSLAVQGTGAGVAGGAVLTRATTEATATSTGILFGGADAGEQAQDKHGHTHKDKDKEHPHGKPRGHDKHKDKNKHHDEDDKLATDLLFNSGALTVNADSEAVAVSVGLEVGIALAGVAAGASLTDVSTISTAEATGIGVSNAGSWIWNEGDLIVDADADAIGASVSLNVTGAYGVAAGASLARAIVSADADATGIAGGNGIDHIVHSGSIDTTSLADADATSVSANITIGIPLGAALANTNVTADANSIGIAAGGADDWILSSGHLGADATATATGVGVTVNILGAALGNMDVDALSYAAGIAGGAGRDVIEHSGDIVSDASATGNGTSVSVTAVGASITDASNYASAQGYGIDAGSGKDEVLNSGAITTTATALARATGVSVALTGAALNNPIDDANSDAYAYASGIYGGADRDTLWHTDTGVINSTATATARDVEVGVTQLGAAIGDISARANAFAFGLDGGDGDDKLWSAGGITTAATADSRGTNVAVSIIGAALTNVVEDSSITAGARAAALVGGEGEDRLYHYGISSNTATATTGSVGVSVALEGAAMSDASTNTIATAFGLDGGASCDRLYNEGTLNTIASAISNATTVNVNLIGAAIGDSGTRTEANAHAMAGGSAGDVLENAGVLTATASASTDVDDVSVSLVGASLTDISTQAYANASGIAGGEDKDSIWNHGMITSSATGNVVGSGNNWNIGGTSIGAINTTAEVFAYGIDGGAGKDHILNEGSITTTATATGSARGTAVVALGGFAAADAVLSATATATGIAGGDGNDVMENHAAITTTATATNNSRSVNYGTFGAANGDANTTATANAYGMDGGEGADKLLNNAAITANATATTNTNNKAIVIGGYAEAEDVLAANANAIGLLGDVGEDWLRNQAQLTLNATANMTATSSSVSIFGAGSAGGNATMSPTSIGIDGGLDSDVIENLAGINVTSSTTSTLTSSNFTFGGTGQAAGTFASRVHALGIVGADGDDTIHNEGDIVATANSTSTQSSSSTTIFGTSAASGTADANPLAIAIDSGEGKDTLINTALLDANTSVSMTLNGGSFTFAGTANANGLLTATTTAIGMRAGSDDDLVFNSGTLDIDAVGTLTTSANPNLVFGGVSATSVATSDPFAYGMLGEGGNDELINADVVNVRARGSATSTGATYSFAGGSSSTAVMTANANATGMHGGTGNDVLTNQESGSVIVLADAVGSASGGTRSSIANARLEGTVSSVGVATGMHGGDGDIDMVDNLGSIDVDVLTNATSNNNVHAGVAFAGGVTRSRATTDGVGYGIRVDGAQSYVWNSGSVNVLLDGDATAKAYSDGEVLAFLDVDSQSRAWATVDAVRVYGISGGHGTNAISNSGNITVAATPYAYAETVADGDGVDGDGTAYSNASTTATSYGISVGNGNNGILNDAGGVIDVNTTSNARAYALSDSDVGGSANSDSVANSRATAFGIRTGNGDNYIVNNGTITVNATAIASTYTRATNDNLTLCAPFGLGCTTINLGDSDADAVVTRAASAYGIYTGSGADVVFNRGTITTAASGGTLIREAIHTGAGDDEVILGDGSVTTGDIDLGADNDLLTFIGTPIVNGAIRGSEGTNTLAFESEGAFSFDGYVTDFSRAIKTGEGTYSVTGLTPLTSIEVHKGTLEIKGDYCFDLGSRFAPSVMSGAGGGQLVITGKLDFAGYIDVHKGKGHHRDGDQQVVLHAQNGIGNGLNFSNIQLPQNTPLLAFSSEVTSHDVMINTAVRPFNTVAQSRNERAIAGYLDNLLPAASGDVSVALGEVQAISAGGHGQAFRSLSPEGYVNSQQAVKAGFGQYAGTVQQRTRGLRQLQMYNQFLQPGFFTSEQGQPLYHLPDHELGTVMNARQAMFRTHGSWFKGFQQSGQLDQSAANTGFNFDTSGVAFGFDAWLDQKRAIGASMASTTTDMRVEGSASDSDIDSQIFSVYATYATDKAYVDGGLSYGDNSYTTRRTVTVSGLTEQVFSEHDGDMFGASFGAGLFVPVRNWKMEMYTALNYLRQKEDGFAESGAGGISLNVAPRSANSLMSELGMRFGRHVQKRSSDWYTEAGIAWVHEFREDTAVEAGFADAGSNTFIVEGQDIDDDGVLFNLGVRYVSRKGLNTSLEYRTEQRGNYSDDMIAAQLQYRF